MLFKSPTKFSIEETETKKLEVVQAMQQVSHPWYYRTYSEILHHFVQDTNVMISRGNVTVMFRYCGHTYRVLRVAVKDNLLVVTYLNFANHEAKGITDSLEGFRIYPKFF